MSFSKGQDVELVRFFENIGSAKDRRSFTHGIHPYPAKFIPHIPRILIERLSKPGDRVLDPMCGSGTTVLESALLGRRSIGIDSNPIATLTTKAKTAPLSSESLAEIEEVLWRLRERSLGSPSRIATAGRSLFTNQSHWFEDHIVDELFEAREIVRAIRSEAARAFVLCAFSAIIVPVSRQESETRWRAVDKSFPTGTVYTRLATRIENSVRAFSTFRLEEEYVPLVSRGDARNLPLPNDSIDLVVTSPPYANSHDYYLYNKLRMFWLGHDVYSVQSNEIGSRNKHSDRKQNISSYVDAMTEVVSQMSRVLRQSGVGAIVVGDAVVRGEFFDMSEIYSKMIANVGMNLEAVYAFSHKEYTSSYMASFGTKLPKRTHTLVFSKPG